MKKTIQIIIDFLYYQILASFNMEKKLPESMEGKIKKKTLINFTETDLDNS